MHFNYNFNFTFLPYTVRNKKCFILSMNHWHERITLSGRISVGSCQWLVLNRYCLVLVLFLTNRFHFAVRVYCITVIDHGHSHGWRHGVKRTKKYGTRRVPWARDFLFFSCYGVFRNLLQQDIRTAKWNLFVLSKKVFWIVGKKLLRLYELLHHCTIN